MRSEVRLLKDATVTAVPSGQEVVLPKGALVEVTQTLGGAATLRDSTGMYRAEGDALEALGEEVMEAIGRDVPEVSADEPFSVDQVWQVLKTCFDPEIPLNIVDLGLIYSLQTKEVENGQHHVDVQMTLTAVGCGMGPAIAEDARGKIERLPHVASAKVEIVWDPQWTPHMISEEGRQVLGLE